MHIFKKKDKAPLKQFAMDLVRHDRDQRLNVSNENITIKKSNKNTTDTGSMFALSKLLKTNGSPE